MAEGDGDGEDLAGEEVDGTESEIGEDAGGDE